MRIVRFRHIPGPNLYHYKPVTRMTIDLEDLDRRESCEFPGFIDRLLAMLPGLREHGCSRRHPGGFVERMREGTYLGHVIEHVALELSDAAGKSATFGRTVSTDEPGRYHVIIQGEIGELNEALLEHGVNIVQACLIDGRIPVANIAAHLQNVRARFDLGPSTRALANAATARGIPWRRVNETSLLVLGHGVHRRFVHGTETWNTRSVAVDVCSDKNLLKTMLAGAFIPVPRGAAATSLEAAIRVFENLERPVVVKPLDGNHGDGVTTGITTLGALIEAFRLAKRRSPDVIVEEMLFGQDYRVLVVNGRVAAASLRRSARVVGDGKRTIAQLVKDLNADPRRGNGHDNVLTRVSVDERVQATLHAQGLDLQSVPAQGRDVRLSDIANLSAGGTATDVTKLVHPSIASLCERAALTVGLDVCGVDLIADDISAPLGPRNGIVELNSSPGIRMHLAPSQGEPVDPSARIIEGLFPTGTNGRIPIVAVTGTNGKTTTTRLIAQALTSMGHLVGYTSTDGVYIGEDCLEEGDLAGPVSARALLEDPRIDAAVLETSRGGIVREGLGFDWCDVGVILNIQLDHVGQDGIDDVDDLVHVKALVAERVKPGGTIVLNVADERLRALYRRLRDEMPDRRFILFSESGSHELLEQHLASGQSAFVLENDWIVERTSEGVSRLLPAANIPLTLGGAARHQIENVLATLAAIRGLDKAANVALAALCAVRPDFNPGRAELYAVRGGWVLVDYGHNPEAFEVVGRMVAAWSLKRTAVLGVPGDRGDTVMVEAGRRAGRHFEKIIVKEDMDRRGRAAGEVANLLVQGIEEAGGAAHIVLDEKAAVAKAISEIGPRETVVVFYEKRAPVMEILHACGAVRCQESMARPVLTALMRAG